LQKKDMPTDDSVREKMFANIASWQGSGLSQKEWCRQQEMPYHIFHYWYRRYREQHSGPASNNTFVRLTVPADDASCEVILADGTKIVFREPVPAQYLKSLLF
jgi:hypothetical protein